MSDIKTPYLNGHMYEFDLCWLVEKILSFESQLNQAIDLKTIHYADPIQWNITTQYAPNTVVVDPKTGTAYMSKVPVPAGILLTNVDYWTVIFNYQDIYTKIMEGVAFYNGKTDYASKALLVNDLVWYGLDLYRVTKPIEEGGKLIPETNMVKTSIESLLSNYYGRDRVATLLNDTLNVSENYTVNSRDIAETSTNRTIKVTADRGIDIDGNDSVHIDGTSTLNVGGLRTEVYAGNRTQQVNGTQTERYNSISSEVKTKSWQIKFPDKTIDLHNLETPAFTTPEEYGAKGDGITDDTVAIQAAFNSGKNVFFKRTSYKVTESLIVPNGLKTNLGGAVFVTDMLTPLFVIDRNKNNASGIVFDGNGCDIIGTCGYVFSITGVNNFAISPSNYAKHIIIKNFDINTGQSVEGFVKMNTAVRNVYISNCYTWSKNGIVSDGKAVEIYIDNCNLYISGNGNPIKMSSSLGSDLYNEGWMLSNCTIDGSGASVSIQDVFVLQITNCYIGCNFKILYPVSTGSTGTGFITISNTVFNDVIDLGGSGSAWIRTIFSGCEFNDRINGNGVTDLVITSCMYTGDQETCILFTNNVHRFLIDGVKFTGQNKVCINVSGNNSDGVIQNVICDKATEPTGIYWSGSGTYVTMHNITGSISNERFSSTIASPITTSASNVLSPKIGKGATGLLFLNIHMGEPVGDNDLIVTLPSGMLADPKLLTYPTNARFINATIPFKTTANITDAITIKSSAKNVALTGNNNVAIQLL